MEAYCNTAASRWANMPDVPVQCRKDRWRWMECEGAIDARNWRWLEVRYQMREIPKFSGATGLPLTAI